DPDLVVAGGAVEQRGVDALTAVERHLGGARDADGRRERVVPGEPHDGGDVLRRLAAGDGRLHGEAADDERAARVVATPDPVRVRRAHHDDGVGRCVAVAVEPAQVDVHGLHRGSGEVVDGDGVDAAERADADALDPVEVHHDRGDVTGEPDAGAVRGDLDLLT